MRITRKQQEEMDFLSNYLQLKYTPTQEEIVEYLEYCVNGKGNLDNRSLNRLFQSKRRFEIAIVLWKEDIKEGILHPSELQEEYKESNYWMRFRKCLI